MNSVNQNKMAVFILSLVLFSSCCLAKKNNNEQDQAKSSDAAETLDYCTFLGETASQCAAQAIKKITNKTISDKEKFEEIYALYIKNDYPIELATVAYAEAAYDWGKLVYGDKAENTAKLFYNYAYAVFQLHFRSIKKVEPLLEEALSYYDEVFGQDAAESIPIYHDLCQLQSNQSDSGKIKHHYCKKMVALSRRYDGKKSLAHAEILSAAGNSLVNSYDGSITLADDYLLRAHKIFDDQLGGDNPQTGLVAFNLGKFYLRLGKIGKSEKYFKRALNGFEIEDASSSHFELTTHAFLVDVLERRGKRDEATEHCLAIGAMQPAADTMEYQPLFKRSPRYPQSALQSGTEGYVTVEYTVNDKGIVKNPEIVDSSITNKEVLQASIDAALKFRYAPRFINGNAVDTLGVRNKFHYRISK